MKQRYEYSGSVRNLDVVTEKKRVRKKFILIILIIQLSLEKRFQLGVFNKCFLILGFEACEVSIPFVKSRLLRNPGWCGIFGCVSFRCVTAEKKIFLTR